MGLADAVTPVGIGLTVTAVVVAIASAQPTTVAVKVKTPEFVTAEGNAGGLSPATDAMPGPVQAKVGAVPPTAVPESVRFDPAQREVGDAVAVSPVGWLFTTTAAVDEVTPQPPELNAVSV